MDVNKQEGWQDRDHLIRFCKERIEMKYVESVNLGWVEPVVLVLDALDDEGFRILRLSAGEEAARQHRDRELDEGLLPTATLALPREDMIEGLADKFPETAAKLRHVYCPDHLFFVVAVANDGAMLTMLSKPETD